MRLFIVMLQFLTRIPINKNYEVSASEFSKGIVFFPVIGLIIGGFNALLFFICDKLTSSIVAATFCVFANIIITGALHLDGLADTCDGVFSSRTKERMLEIMKDSRIGAFGTIALLFDILFRIAFIYSINSDIVIYSILLSPVVAKTLVGYLAFSSKDAREGKGMGSLFMSVKDNKPLIGCIVIGFGIVYGVFGSIGIMLMLFCFIICILFRNYIYSKLDGMTGDTFGAANEIIELSFFFLLNIAKRYLLL